MKMGFQKLAVVDDPDGKRDAEVEESHKLRNTLMAGAAVTPFAGMIGQQRMQHLNQGAEMSFQDLKKTLKPGDVVLSADQRMGLLKGIVGTMTGTPQGYHVATVRDNNGNIIESTPRAGLEGTNFKRRGWHLDSRDRLQVLRPNFSPDERKEFLRNLEQGVDVGNLYEKKLHGALKARGVPEAKDWANFARGGTYDTAGGLKGGIKEFLVPKLHGPEAIEAQKTQIQEARAQFLKGPDAHVAGEIGAARVQKLMNKDIGQHNLLYGSVTPSCVGGVCSTFPAQAMPKGKSVVPGKLPNDMLASDFLRSEHFTPVARYQHGPMTLHEKVLSHGPTLARAGIGALGAAGVYGVSKWFNRKKGPDQENPDQAGVTPSATPGARPSSG